MRKRWRGGAADVTSSSEEKLGNLVITILRLAGATSITAALRYHARRPSRPLRTIMKC